VAPSTRFDEEATVRVRRAVTSATLCGPVLVAVCAAIPAVAAAGPKTGYYIEPKSQTYIITNSKVTALTSFSSTCALKAPAGAYSGTITISRPIKLLRDGSFHFNGKGKLAGSSAAKLTVAASFKNGRYVGVLTMTSPAGYCKPTHFNAKYYGTHPGG
jgi:hypothetical protein